MAAHHSITFSTFPPDPYSDDPFSWTYVLFRPIPDFPGYGIDTLGNVWSCREMGTRKGFKEHWRRLKLILDHRSGYLLVGFNVNNRRFQRFVHSLMLEVFIEPRPAGKLACHFPDIDRTNNNIRNLVWGTHKSNWADSVAQGTATLGSRNHMAVIDESDVIEIRRLLRSGLSHSEIAARFDIRRHVVTFISNGRYWRHVPREGKDSPQTESIYGY